MVLGGFRSFHVLVTTTQGLVDFKLRLDGSGQGLTIFLKMSFRTQHNYL